MVWDPKKAFDVLSEYLFKISVKEIFRKNFKNAARDKEYPDLDATNSEYYNVPFNMQEMKHALHHTKKFWT